MEVELKGIPCHWCASEGRERKHMWHSDREAVHGPEVVRVVTVRNEGLGIRPHQGINWRHTGRYSRSPEDQTALSSGISGNWRDMRREIRTPCRLERREKPIPSGNVESALSTGI